jgi:glycogen(starch) synthase
VVTLHGAGKLVGGPSSLLEQTLGRADWVVGCSAAVLEQGRRLVPTIAARSSIIHNAVEPPALSPSPLPFAPPRLVCLGRLVTDKGFDLALAAFPAILTRRPDARLTIAGDGPARAELVRQAARLRLGPAVHLPGWVSPADVPALLNTATVVLLPSRQDSLPLVALEAALMARPVVATDVGGLPEVVVHRRTGLLVPPEDPAALAAALMRLLDRPALATRLGAAARTRAHQHFSWPRYLDAYDELYERLATEGPIG